MDLAVLFWFYKEPDICLNRLKILRKENPKIKIFGLFGGDKSCANQYQSKLKKYLDDFYAFPLGKDQDWKWLNGDLMLLDWYDKRGRSLAWDSVVIIQWDNIVFGSLPGLFPDIKKGEIFLFGLKEIDEATENEWLHVKKGSSRAGYLHFKQYVKKQYDYRDKLWCCFFALEVFPRIFFEKYLMAQNRELGFIEYRVPTYAKIFNMPFYAGNFGLDIGIGYNKNGPLQYSREIKKLYIRRQLRERNGWKIFHPYRRIWGFSIHKISPTYYLPFFLRFVLRCIGKARRLWIAWIRKEGFHNRSRNAIEGKE